MRLAFLIVLVLSFFACGDDTKPVVKDSKPAVEVSVQKEASAGKEASVIKEASAADAAVVQ
jgi:hypothetical protein